MTWIPGVGLYGHGMHDYLIDELELGARVASGLDNENNARMGVWVDISYAEWCRNNPPEPAGEVLEF